MKAKDLASKKAHKSGKDFLLSEAERLGIEFNESPTCSGLLARFSLADFHG